MDVFFKLEQYVNQHKGIYLFGAGLWGKTIYSFLKQNNCEIKGFITTEGGPEIFGKRNFRARDILPQLGNYDGIIIAMDELHRVDVMKNAFYCDLLLLSEMEFRQLEVSLYYDKSLFCENDKYLSHEVTDLNWDEILIIQLEVTFGDMIWSTAFVRELRRNHPNGRITFVMNTKFKSLYEACPYIDRIIEYDCRNMGKILPKDMLGEISEFRNQYLNRTYDAIFLPRLLPCGHADAWENVLLALSIRTRYRFGHTMEVIPSFRFVSEVLDERFTTIVKHVTAHHEAANDLSMIEAFGGLIIDKRMELWCTAEDKAFSERVCEKFVDKRFVVVAPVGSKSVRNWNAKKYGKVIKEVLERHPDCCFIICGGEDAVKAASIIIESVGDGVLDMTGKTTLRQTVALIEKCFMYLGTDTGLMHMASASGIPIVEVTHSLPDAPDYWGSSPTRTGPWQVKSVVIRPPKGLDGCKYVCQREEPHCICQIEESEVISAVDKILSEG